MCPNSRIDKRMKGNSFCMLVLMRVKESTVHWDFENLQIYLYYS